MPDATSFLLGGSVIVWVGVRLSALGDRLAHRTGLGKALTGTLFLGLTTALPGQSAFVAAACTVIRLWPSAMRSEGMPRRRPS